MNSLARACSALCIAGIIGGCASASRPQGAVPDRTRIQIDEIRPWSNATAYQVIRALRPEWLDVRARAASLQGSQRRVYLDDLHLGGLETLERIPASSIGAIYFFDGPAAVQRWGTDHSGGVIQIHTRR